MRAPPPRRPFPGRRCGFPGAVEGGAEVGVGVGVNAGAGVDVGVEVRVEEVVEEEAGRGAGAMGSNLRLFSSWTSGRGVLRRAGAEPVAMTESLRFNTRVFAALRRSTSAFPVTAASSEAELLTLMMIGCGK